MTCTCMQHASFFPPSSSSRFPAHLSHVGDEASSVTPGVEREELEEVEREEERGVAETEDVFAESSAVPSVGRQMSIMRASGKWKGLAGEIVLNSCTCTHTCTCTCVPVKCTCTCTCIQYKHVNVLLHVRVHVHILPFLSLSSIYMYSLFLPSLTPSLPPSLPSLTPSLP